MFSEMVSLVTILDTKQMRSSGSKTFVKIQIERADENRVKMKEK